VKRILAILMACLFMVAVMAVVAAPAFAQAPCPPQCKVNGGGHQPSGEAKGIPTKNPAGHCAPGQNKNLSPGGQKKCK
jgi:hypothetical protein